VTPDQEARYSDLKIRTKLAADRLQRIVDTLAEAAFLRELGVRPPEDETAQIVDYERTLKRIDEITAEEEALLQEAGILPKPN
jgi:hypothetical protein